MTSANKFSFSHADGRLETFVSAGDLSAIFADYEYVTAIVQAVDEAAPRRGIHFVVTWCHNLVPPLDPESSVLIVVGDERAQVPNGVSMARWVFRTGSPKTIWPIRLDGLWPLPLRLFSAVRDLRNMTLRVQRAFRRQAPLGTPGHVESIPIGFVGATVLEPLAMDTRVWDVTFAGGAGKHRPWGAHRIPLCAKAAARLAMRSAVVKLEARFPKVRGRFIFPDLNPGSGLGRDDYYKLLQQTKISLCPRGNFAETFRLFESAKLGCAILCDPLPRCWYFENHPFIEIRDWRKINPVVMALLNDRAALRERGERSRKWWDEVASPGAVAATITMAIARDGFQRGQEGKNSFR